LREDDLVLEDAALRVELLDGRMTPSRKLPPDTAIEPEISPT